MHRLRRLLRPLIRRRDSEHGAIAALFAILLSGGVLIGMGAVVIDVGSLYLEREELQSGADAASWAIAVNCVDKPATCTSNTQTPIAGTYAKKNAKDNAADAVLCFNNTACPANWSGLAPCPALPTPAAGYSNGTYVEVRTSTSTSANGKLLPPSFAQVLTGGAYTGESLGACGRVNWGPPAAAKVFALGISVCDWKRMTSNNQVYYNALGTLLDEVGVFSLIGLTPATPGKDDAITQVLPAAVLGLPLPSCTTPVDLHEPRGYVWLSNADLSPPDSNCMLDLKVGDLPRAFLLAGITTGVTCAQKLQTYRAKGIPVLVPIFDEIEQTLLSVAPTYRIAGFAAFVVTGYTGLLSGVLSGANSILSGLSLASGLSSVLCATSSCIYGYFTKAIVPVDKPVFGTGKDFGSTVIGRTG